MRKVVAFALVIVTAVLALALGWIWVVILPVGGFVFGCVWLVNAIVRGRAPSAVLRSVPDAELLGRGGPDDPEAKRTQAGM